MGLVHGCEWVWFMGVNGSGSWVWLMGLVHGCECVWLMGVNGSDWVWLMGVNGSAHS